MSFIKRKIIKTLMNIFPVFPSASQLTRNEFFRHKSFTNADKDTKRKIMLNSVQCRYDYEQEYPFEEIYFKGLDFRRLLKNKIVLDLGCFTGGESIAWAKRYNVKKMYGIDIDNAFIESARLFAEKMMIDACFKVGCGEKLPFRENFFDAIISFDAFEHVQDLSTVLRECWRALKQGGLLFCVFPQYLSPFEHHLSLATKTPCLHWFFSPKDLMEVYNEIIEKRGPHAYWYRRSQPNLKKWEKLNGINGTSIANFRKMIDEFWWNIYYHNALPIFSTGRFFRRHLFFKLLSIFLRIFVRIPGLNELFTDRIVYILQKNKTKSIL